MFVGDSVQRGQFESLVCMLQSVIPEGKKSLERIPPRKIFKIQVPQNLPILLSQFQQNLNLDQVKYVKT